MPAIPCCVLVDDDPDFLSFVRLCLFRLCPRLHIVTFLSGLEALGFLGRHHADLVITDFRMPLLDGLRLTKRVRALHPSMPIIVMSGDAIEAQALATGANAFIAKADLTHKLPPMLIDLGLPNPNRST